MRLLRKTFTQSRSLFIWLLQHQTFCLHSEKTVLDHVICMTIAHKFCDFFDCTEFSLVNPTSLHMDQNF